MPYTLLFGIGRIIGAIPIDDDVIFRELGLGIGVVTCECRRWACAVSVVVVHCNGVDAMKVYYGQSLARCLWLIRAAESYPGYDKVFLAYAARGALVGGA